MGKRTKRNNEFDKRLPLWQEMLTNPNGVSYKEFELKTDGKYDESTPRGDIKHIKQLLAYEGISLKEEGTRNKRFFLTDATIDLYELYTKYSASSNSAQLLELLTYMKGVFPDEFYEGICDTFGDIIKDRDNSNQYISFDSNIDILGSLRFFSTIYSHIVEKKVMNVTYCKINDENNLTTVRLHPEFLKQYHSIWYVFGNGFNEQKESLGIIRIRLDLITDIESISSPFIASGIDYDDYFSEIIGVENPPFVELWHIEFLVKNKIFNRVLTNPLHEVSQKRCTKLDHIKPGYKGFSIDVKENIELTRKFLAYGNDIIVLSPDKFKKKIKKLLVKALANY